VELGRVLEKSHESLNIKSGNLQLTVPTIVTYETDHVDHCRVSCNQQQESDLDRVRLLDMARLDL
jgi:predicted ATP-binding protein involved in virulence